MNINGNVILIYNIIKVYRIYILFFIGICIVVVERIEDLMFVGVFVIIIDKFF